MVTKIRPLVPVLTYTQRNTKFLNCQESLLTTLIWINTLCVFVSWYGIKIKTRFMNLITDKEDIVDGHLAQV